jgi:hypothetical protein
MRVMIAVVTLMVVSVLSLSMMTPAGAELTGQGDKLEASVN